MPVRVGIPRYLGYFTFYPLWKTFFEEIGLEVITSPPTNQQILNDGVAEAVNDACIPIKLYHGHVVAIKDQVDVLFVPRFVKVRKLETETFCPKFLGLPDLLRASINNLPELLDTRVELTSGRFELFRIAREIGERFGVSLARITRAYILACQALRRYRGLMCKGSCFSIASSCSLIICIKEWASPFSITSARDTINCGFWKLVTALTRMPWRIPFLVPKWRKIVPSATPASWAISLVVAPSKPFSEKTLIAAFIIFFCVLLVSDAISMSASQTILDSESDCSLTYYRQVEL
jgi:hypothetical protein